MKIKNKILRNISGRGFTLFEVVIVISIVAIMAAVVIASYPKLGARMMLSRVAREIALSIRQAQVYGIAVKEFPQVAGNPDKYPPYGIYFEPVSTGANEVIIFGDYCDNQNPSTCAPLLGYAGDGNGLYEEGDGCNPGLNNTECLERLRIRDALKIENVCVVSGAGATTCWDGGRGQLRNLVVTFERPSPEAAIIINDNPAVKYNSAEIKIRSTKDPSAVRTVRIWITGQISVLNR